MKILKFTTLACAIMTLIAFGHADTQEAKALEKFINKNSEGTCRSL